jgi:hypothetical protein
MASELSLKTPSTGLVTLSPADTATNKVITIPAVTGTMNTSGAVNTVPAGTVSTPAITTTGDTNTGIFFPAADTIAFTEGGVESMRINASGTLVLNQGQIQFPATQVPSANANTLDDYEEGTFTATFFSGINGTGTNLGSTSINTYVKIGRFVLINFNRGGVGSGNTLSFTGLPFSLVNGTESGITADSVTCYGDLSFPTTVSFRGAGDGLFARGSFCYQV